LSTPSTIRGDRARYGRTTAFRPSFAVWWRVKAGASIWSSTFGNPALRADGKAAYDGWPDSPRIEELRRAWLDAADLAEQRRIAVELLMQVWQDVPFITMGEYWQTTAYRKVVNRHRTETRLRLELRRSFNVNNQRFIGADRDLLFSGFSTSW
jgi:ABC-type transport system substrate-binding protein